MKTKFYVSLLGSVVMLVLTIYFIQQPGPPNRYLPLISALFGILFGFAFGFRSAQYNQEEKEKKQREAARWTAINNYYRENRTSH